MSGRFTRLIIPIVALLLVAIFIVAPNSRINLSNLGINVDRSFPTRLGLDLVGGVQALLEADLPETTSITSEDMGTARSIVENRVNGLGVSEAVVQQVGDRRILIELPGETDPQTALHTIEQTGLLEFVDMSSIAPQEAQNLVGTKIQTDFGAQATAPVTTTQNVFPTLMTGAALSEVGVTTSTTGEYQVSFNLKADESDKFASFTGSHINQVLAIVLDKQVISAPTINSAITQGSGVITGHFTAETANQLAVQLRYGSLPIPLKVISSTTVGPTLGQESLRKSLFAGLIGMTVVILYMLLYYRLPGALADIALIIYTLLVLSIFKLIPVTLTLPGIAGFILSIGVAVDANVLIFERMREELRAGRTLRQSTELAWSRAWPSIRDSNLSTLITCLILFWFGSTFGASIVKGFSLTLAIGVLVSMFTAIIVTRTFIHLALDNLNFVAHQRWFGM